MALGTNYSLFVCNFVPDSVIFLSGFGACQHLYQVSKHKLRVQNVDEGLALQSTRGGTAPVFLNLQH